MVKKYKDNQTPAVITEITIDEKTYRRETFKPNLINYMYGKNGSGKTTISEFIKNPASNYGTSIPRSDFELLVYNNTFIQEEIQSYGNIPGLFTITKQNAEVNKQIGEINKEIEYQKAAISKIEDEKKAINDKRGELLKSISSYVWETIAEKKKFYSDAIKAGTKQVALTKIKAAKPIDHAPSELQLFYMRAFGPDDDRYKYYSKIPHVDISHTILSTPILSSGDTPFAKFLEEIHASDWVKSGHDKYQHIAGDKCPYCQQKLPHNFEEMLASCFDASYQKQIEELERNAKNFQRQADNILTILNENIQDEFMTIHLHEYMALKKSIETSFSSLSDIWERKIISPATAFVAYPNVNEDINAINKCIDIINEEIKNHNSIIDDREKSKKKCTDMIWESLAFKCRTRIDKYDAEDQYLLKIENELSEELEIGKEKLKAREDELAEKAKETINTTDAMNSINQLIRDAGFQGFKIREKANAKYVYELVRDDGSVVKHLSEGERNFIGFLYFYNIVMNSRADDGIQRDKVVVIDDPVSSMDSSALFSVATLTRHMIEICYNNYDMESGGPDFIKQFICLTHNPFFFKEISYNHITDYECVNYYEITKDGNNQSHIKLCHKESDEVGGKYVNYSPIKNTYDALWTEYKNTTEPIILMNVIRRILEYYFLQIGGYKGNSIRTEVLDRNKDKFPSQWEYDAAASMIAYINTGAAGFDDGLYFDQSSISVDQMRDVFRNIFYALNQEQHYDYMMR